jgi:hypothetical protein
VQLSNISVTADLLRELDPSPGISYEGGSLQGNLLYTAALPRASFCVVR